MDRRGFLQALGASIAAIVAAPAIGFSDFPAFPAPVGAAVPELWIQPADPLHWFTTRMAQHVSRLVGPLKIVEGDTVGSPGLTHQYNVAVALWALNDVQPDYEARYVVPAAHAFASRMKRAGITRCGVLELPHGVDQAVMVKSPELGIAMRGLSQYAPYGMADSDHYEVRFDVLCG
jgi:hypothetical protein